VRESLIEVVEVDTHIDAKEIVTESDTLIYVHVREIMAVGLITESKAQFQRIIEDQECQLIRVKRMEFPRVITQDATIVRYRFISDLEEFNIAHLGLVNNWAIDIKISYNLIEAAAKKFGVNYKKAYDSAYRFHDTVSIEQRLKELNEVEKLSIFDEVASGKS
jgi:hypothetical protein